ncbi:MAG: hypothetical protein HYY16_10805 [Planctomycetes bacterium]|nr:hypothetical protein [Planctomycetota bacterium]
MHRIAVVGIDGSGKSTVVRRLQEAARGEVFVLHCPLYHETADAPLSELSRHLHALSEAADQLGSFPLKATAMVLQMTLFGPVEEYLTVKHRPRIFVSEHHPIVDSLAYAPVYVQAMSAPFPCAELEPKLRASLGPAFESILWWHLLEVGRLGLKVSFWDLAAHMADLFRLPPAAQVSTLMTRFRTALPDTLMFLDVPVETAIARLAQRRGTELHEGAAMLELLSRGYRSVVAALARDHPAMKIITLNGTSAVEDALQDLLMHA